MTTRTFSLRLSILMLVIILSSCVKKNHPPTIDDQTFSVDENSPVGTSVGKVLAFDEDGQALTYSILGGNTNSAFSISETDGKITVNNKAAIDYEITSSFTLNIEVKDSKNKNAIADIIINLNNIQIPLNDQSFSIDENSVAGSLVGQIIAPGQILKYSIVSGNTNTAFDISDTDGKITIHNSDAIDYETAPKFTLVVEGKDENNEKANANITINLNNLEAPTTGLMLYMPFNGNLNDLSVNNNAGIDYTSHNYVPGKRSQALDFNGTSDYVRLTNSINSQSGLSLSFWIYTRGVNGLENNGCILTKYSKTNNTRCFMIYSFGAAALRNDNRLSAAFYSDGSSSTYYHDMTKSYLDLAELQVYPNPALWTLTNPTRLIIGEWTHCVVNVTPTAIETWINGKFRTKKTREYSSYFNSNIEPVLIGNSYDSGEGSNNHFNGMLDELRIYNRGLSNDEIRTLFKE
ncbi:MAG TPA: cadherin domain-containing protein [Bacteroidales bacterium]